jgi:hypothetical protein
LVGLTWYNPNSSVLVEGPEIVIRPGWHPSCGDGWFPMSRDTIITGLTAPHADGLACVTCGADYLTVATPYVPVGRSVTGSLACAGCCPHDAQRTTGGVL